MLQLTPARLRRYLMCPCSFDMTCDKQAVRPVWSAGPARAFGTSLYGALADLHSPNRRFAAVSADKLLRRHWTADGYADAKQEASYYDHGVEMLDQHIAQFGQPLGCILGVNVSLTQIVQLGGVQVKLAAVVDRVLARPDGTLELLEYKTHGGGKVPTPQELAADLPTFLYYMLARRTYPTYPQVVVAQLNLHTSAYVEVDYGDQAAAAEQALAVVVQEMEAGRRVPRSSSTCAWCPARRRPACSSTVDVHTTL